MKTPKYIIEKYLKRNEDGFTIIEMAVATVVIGALSVIALATYPGMRKDAITITLTEDVWHAGTKVQGIIILSDDPGQVPESVDFLTSDSSNKLIIKTIASPRGSYCVIGTNSDYDLKIYYSSELGGITTNPSVCGEPGEDPNGGSNGNPDEETTPTDTPSDEPSSEPTNTPTNTPTGEPTGEATPPSEGGSEPTPSGEPTPNPTNDTEPTAEPTLGTVGSDPEPTTEPTNNPPSEPTTQPSPNNPQPTPKPTQEIPEISTNIPATSLTIIKLEVPDDTCKTLIEEKIKARTNMFNRMKHYNLVSIMARLQSGNHTIEDIMANTPEGKRYTAAMNAISKNKKCSTYVEKKNTVVKYYERGYTEEQLAYMNFIRNLNEHSADIYAYNQAYIKLYNKVYGVNA